MLNDTCQIDIQQLTPTDDFWLDQTIQLGGWRMKDVNNWNLIILLWQLLFKLIQSRLMKATTNLPLVVLLAVWHHENLIKKVGREGERREVENIDSRTTKKCLLCALEIALQIRLLFRAMVVSWLFKEQLCVADVIYQKKVSFSLYLWIFGAKIQITSNRN